MYTFKFIVLIKRKLKLSPIVLNHRDMEMSFQKKKEGYQYQRQLRIAHHPIRKRKKNLKITTTYEKNAKYLDPHEPYFIRSH